MNEQKLVTLQKYSYPVAGGKTVDTLISSAQVWAESPGVKRTEFYQAVQAGISADAVYTVWRHEYHGEQRLIDGGDAYDIKRSYPVDTDHVELTCQRRTGL